MKLFVVELSIHIGGLVIFIHKCKFQCKVYM